MTVKGYSFPTEAKAEELILNLVNTDNKLVFNKITTTETTHGIVCLKFQDKYEYNQEKKEIELIKKGLTYDVDVIWKESPNEDWSGYEVNINTPNHKFL
jgi:hypothetical protein